MSDLNPILEIDNELFLFRHIFYVRNKSRTSLLISQGGRITQHLVEFLAYREGTFEDNIHDYTFGEFLDKCDFIDQDIRKFIFTCYDHRKTVISTSKYAKQFEGMLLEFLEAFNAVLIWFRWIYQMEFDDGLDFKEIDETITFLGKRMKKIKEKNNYDDIDNDIDGVRTVLERELKKQNGDNNYYEKDYLKSMIMEVVGPALNNFENRFDSFEKGVYEELNGVNKKLDNMDVKLDQILDHIKTCINIIHDYQKDVQTQLESAVTAEEIDKIMLEFTDKCVEKIQEYTENYTSTEIYKNEEKRLIETFGKSAWSKLSDKSKTFLTTSKFTYYSMSSSDDLIDYSGVCLLVTKALEVELYNRFFKNFIKYSKGEYRKNYCQYHVSLLNKNNRTKDYYVDDREKNCDLGRITCILGFNRWGYLEDDGK